MKIIHLNTPDGVRFTLFPDNQPHVTLENIHPGEEVKVICSITDSVKLIQLLQTANALTHAGVVKKILFIPYLMAARYDRLMLPGDSFDLEVVAGLINSCGFEKVQLLDVHSPVALEMIHHAENINNRFLVEEYGQENAVLICPDKGASKKVNDYLDWNNRLTEIVYCSKSRDLATGKISLEVQEPEKCLARNCVIIDDICDGGGTFLAIADQIRPAHLSLIITHGIFSKGFTALEKAFNEIIVSNSFCKSYGSEKVKTISISHDPLQTLLENINL